MNSTNQQFHMPWWSTFFNGLILDVQKKMNNADQTQKEAAFIDKMFALQKGAAIADVPCGDGRLSIALAKLGYNVRGIDISPGIIEVANDASSAAEVSVSLQTGDMQKLPWISELDGTFCFGNSFAYFDDAGNKKFLEEVFRVLKPGGSFILQSNLIAESILTKPLSRTWYPFEETFFLHATSYDSGSATLTSEYTLVRGNEREEKKAHYRIYQLKEVQGMMRSVGFRKLETFGSLSGDPFKLGDLSAYIVAEK